MLRRAAAAAEVLGWWVALTAVWTVLISSVDPLETAVGAAAALLAACAARGARRAAGGGLR
ncbi:hypothetical protein ABZ442_11070 [Streptomyces triculaminicus]|uniref:hypothetical protein n=1 Tax=Streptomyces triculaminicus TaxID=2816232 RepID=UPI0033F4F14E